MTGCIGGVACCLIGFPSYTVTATESTAKTAEKSISVVSTSAIHPFSIRLKPPDFRAVATYEKDAHDHRTGRKCAVCNGVLLDSIINFGEFLLHEPLQRARDHASKADLCLALGSSLTVPPANGIPEIVGKKKGAKLAICNLQETDLDGLSDIRVYSKTDDLMEKVMQKLDIPIPPFVLHRRLLVELETKEGRRQISVRGVDVDGTPFEVLRSVKLEYNRRVARSEPFVINFRGDLDEGTQLKLELEFMGHYGEPNLEIIHTVGDAKTLHLLEYDPYTRAWKATKQTAVDNVEVDAEETENVAPAPEIRAFVDLTI